ncbi:hypothetical protein AY599_09250 [Leptolyngbya valderiana BDU 20041]|nr:hypothetical protein AY599_09250 [Leptolyngbya valderiana BDU 20041]
MQTAAAGAGDDRVVGPRPGRQPVGRRRRRRRSEERRQLVLAAQGLHGLQGFAAAQGLQGLQGFAAAQGLQGLHPVLAAQGLQGLQAEQLASCTAPGASAGWAAAAGRPAAPAARPSTDRATAEFFIALLRFMDRVSQVRFFVSLTAGRLPFGLKTGWNRAPRHTNHVGARAITMP